MEKLETPLTWALAILILGCLTLQDYANTISTGWANQWGASLNEKDEEINNNFSWSHDSNEKNTELKSVNDEEIDSVLQIVLKENEKYLASLDNTSENCHRITWDKETGQIIKVEEIKE